MLEALQILIVDDDEDVLETVNLYLEARGYEVTARLSPRRALHDLRDRTYDLVLSDIKMAEMDGFEFVRAVRSMYPDIGIILMTGHEDEYPMTQALAAGADGYLTKPFNLDKLSLLFEEAYWDAISRSDWWEERAVC